MSPSRSAPATCRSAASSPMRPIVVRQNGVPVKIVCAVRRQGFHAARGARGFRHRKAGRPQGQDHHGHVVSGHHVLCAARPPGERRPDQRRRRYPVRRPGRRLANGGDRQIGRHGRRAGLDSAGRSRRRGHQGAADRRVLSAHGAGHRRVRSDHQGQARHGARLRQGGAARHEGHHGRSRTRRRSTS